MENCNICTGKNNFVLHKDSIFRYNICKSCGHVFQSGRKTQEYYNSIPYTLGQESNDKIMHKKYDAHCKNRANYIYDFIKKFIVNIPNSILDIGCGYGGVLFYLGNNLKTKNLTGIAPDYDENTFSKYNEINFIKSNYEFPISQKYELIILVHSLEHFLSPVKCLMTARENLTDDGILYIEVPNFYWEPFIINQIFTPVHISYFSKNDILNLIEYCGFEILKIKESKFWGNIKLVAKKSTKKYYDENIFALSKENWILKLIKWKLNKIFMYPIYKIIKNLFRIGANS